MFVLLPLFSAELVLGVLLQCGYKPTSAYQKVFGRFSWFLKRPISVYQEVERLSFFSPLRNSVNQQIEIATQFNKY